MPLANGDLTGWEVLLQGSPNYGNKTNMNYGFCQLMPDSQNLPKIPVKFLPPQPFCSYEKGKPGLASFAQDDFQVDVLIGYVKLKQKPVAPPEEPLYLDVQENGICFVQEGNAGSTYLIRNSTNPLQRLLLLPNQQTKSPYLNLLFEVQPEDPFDFGMQQSEEHVQANIHCFTQFSIFLRFYQTLSAWVQV